MPTSTNWTMQRLIAQLPNSVVLDTETTGLEWDGIEEIIELSILRINGTVLYSSLVRSLGPIHPDASAKSGITDDMRTSAPSFPESWQAVSPLLEGRHVAIFNATFDTRILAEEAAYYHLAVLTYFPHCLMRMYMASVQEGKYTLQAACEHYGIRTPTHRGLADTEAARQLLLALANEKESEW